MRSDTSAEAAIVSAGSPSSGIAPVVGDEAPADDESLIVPALTTADANAAHARSVRPMCR